MMNNPIRDTTFNASNELIFTGHGAYSNLQKEVSKGALLRKQKPRQHVDNYLYDKVHVDFDQPSTSKYNYYQQINSGKTRNKSKKIKRVKSPKRCPIRAAELAVPTKRQCIESWRYKSRVMPNYMVDRLKQRVKDERPVVLITDAINCFKNRKKGTKRIACRSNKPASPPNKSNRIADMKMLSAIFGYKITDKLLRPLSLSLNPRLDQINNIVKEEIEALLQDKQKLSQKEFRRTDENIIDEVARKITLWIENILTDTNYRLLEESLRELEEEEGPVLDFIDDLIDRVTSICEPSFYEQSEKSFERLDSATAISVFVNSPDFSKDNIKQLIEEICLQALEEVERQKYNYNESVYKDSNSVSEILGSSIQDVDNEDVLEYNEKQFTIILDQILNNVIIDDSHLIENQDLNNLTNIEFPSKSNIQNKSETLFLDLKSDSIVGYDRNRQEDALDLINRENKYNDGGVSKNDQWNQLKEIDQNQEPESSIYGENDKVDDKNNLEDTEERNVMSMEIENNKIEDEFIESSVIDHLEPESKLNDVRGSEQDEKIIKDSKSDREDNDDDIQFTDAENGEVKLSSEDSLTKVTNKDSVNITSDSKTLESADDDDKNKKVKFSDIDMGLGLNTLLSTKQSAQELLLQVSSSENQKLNINLAPPNNNLLSSADESWPQHMPLPTVMVTDSVNKSVTSLGKIFETDEKGTSSKSSFNSGQVSEILMDAPPFTSTSIDGKIKDGLISPLQKEREIVPDTKSLELFVFERDPKIKNGKKQLHTKKRNKSDHMIKNRENSESVNKSKSQVSTTLKEFNKGNKLSRKFDTQIQKEMLNERHYINQNKIKKETKVKDTRKELPEADVKAKGTEMKVRGMKTDKTLKSDLKNPEQVVSGTGRQIKERKRKSPSRKKPSSTQRETKLKKIGISTIDNDAIFKWCKGLENVIDNLETWNAWINSTCTCIRYLKQKGNSQSVRSIEKTRRKWKILHKSIKQDRVLWSDMQRRNCDGLKSYKKYYYKGDVEDQCKKCDCSKT